jgi:hypothetical protein
MSRDEILTEIIERPRNGYVPVPDLRVIKRPGWQQLITPSLKTGGLNEVSFAQLDAGDIERVIDETIAEYRALGCRFMWRVGPDSTPALRDALARRGLAHTVSNGMARSTDLAAVSDARITVEPVTAANIDAFTHATAEGWGMEPGPLAPVHARVLSHGTAHHMFLARYDGEPAATAAAIVNPRSVYLVGGVTLARFRGRGMYRALVVARMQFGVPLATSHARSDTSAPILERLGFETLCRYDNYNFIP